MKLREFEGKWMSQPTICRRSSPAGDRIYGIRRQRTKQLRDEGFVIENKVEWQGRVKKSWFRFRGKA